MVDDIDFKENIKKLERVFVDEYCVISCHVLKISKSKKILIDFST